jgi:molecular chaperone HscB
MQLDSDDFELLGLPRCHAQDPAAIDAGWRSLLAKVHPDRFVSEGAAAQRLAMQWAVRVNEAHRRIKDPIRRAAYLCELNGQPIGAEDNTAMPAAFLMQQMEWRESLEAATDLAQIDALAAEVRAARGRALEELGRTIDDRGDHAQAARQVRELMFIERFAGDVDARAEALEQ